MTPGLVTLGFPVCEWKLGESFHAPFAFPTKKESAREALACDYLDILHRFNRSGDDTLVAPSEYLEVIAVRK